MYTDEDLESAVDEGIFTRNSLELFRTYVLKQNNTHIADEENIRLITSFNDVFVVIACALVLLSSGWVAHSSHPSLAAIVVSLLSWGLAEFFVLKRKMALPAIFLLLAFVSSLFISVIVLSGEKPTQYIFMLAASLASVGAWLHWRRFKVPITVAAGAATALIFITSFLLSALPILKDYLMYLLFVGGIAIFMIAMHWDSADKGRITSKSDVAFWLHLTAAPLIVHPVFYKVGVFEGNESLLSVAVILSLYFILSLLSLVIDRRAFMVSALVYVLAALTQLLKSYGLASDSFAYVGVFIGFSLLLLSGFWHKARSHLVVHLPNAIRKNVPSLA